MKYVIALGGNAIKNKNSLKSLVRFISKIKEDDKVIITHGNGPQVGELAEFENKSLSLLTAQTEAEIGTMIKSVIINSLNNKKKKIGVAIVLTEVLVDKKDPAFKNPSKPIGRFYDEKEAKKLKEKGFVLKKLIGGYRRVVASPMPQSILNLDSINKLLQKHYIVIASGGGGIPTVQNKNKFYGANAVIDKDYSSSLLARQIKADLLLILSNIDGVFLDYKGKKQSLIRKIKVSKMQKLLKENKFERGSILPKIQAAIAFTKATKKPCIIGNLDKVLSTVNMQNCTVILP